MAKKKVVKTSVVSKPKTTGLVVKDDGVDKELKGMAEVTRKVALEGSKTLKMGVKFNILFMHDMGTLLNGIFTDATLKKQGKVDEELKKLLSYWNNPSWNLSSLYDIRNVAVNFNRDFIEEQCQIRMENGKFLTWSNKSDN